MKNNANTPIKRHQPAYRKIATDLRAKILSGEFKPGSQLPSTEELTVICQTSYFTIHTALMTLVKEGWVERLHGSGTYVAEPKNRFVCAGIYYGENIWANEESAFYRSVHYALQKKLASLKKEVMIFIDSRITSKQNKLPADLSEALQNRKIQCLIAPLVNDVDLLALKALSLPTAFITTAKCPNRVDSDVCAFLTQSIKDLASQGCRSVGLISHCNPDEKPLIYKHFTDAAAAAGLATHPNWTRKPTHAVRKLAKFGYIEFKRLWNCTQKPDGIIIYPDTVVRGAIIAILEAGVRVPEQIKLVFHSNAHTNLLCPFPATWGITDEEVVADRLIELIEKQFKGEKNTFSPLNCTFTQTTKISDDY